MKRLFYKKIILLAVIIVFIPNANAQETVFDRIFFEGFADMGSIMADNPASTAITVSGIALISYGIMKNDKWMLESIQGLENDFWKNTFECANYFGDGIFVLAANSFFFLGGEKEKDTAEKVIEAIAIAGTVAYGIKMTAGRSRPSVADNPYIYNLFTFDDMSMPSGHTAVAFAWASVVGDQYDIGHITYPAAALVGLARVYKNKHWLSDVLIGAAIGTLAGKTAAERPEIDIQGGIYEGNANLMLSWKY